MTAERVLQLHTPNPPDGGTVEFRILLARVAQPESGRMGWRPAVTAEPQPSFNERNEAASMDECSRRVADGSVFGPSSSFSERCWSPPGLLGSSRTSPQDRVRTARPGAMG